MIAHNPTRLMIDCETLGTMPGDAILEIAIQPFNLTGPTGQSLVIEIDLLDSIARGADVDPVSAHWLLEKQFAGHLRGKPLPDSMGLLKRFLEDYRDAEVWAWGMDFERPMLEAAARLAGTALPLWPYFRSRDARTLWHAVFPHEKPTPKVHRAADDVAIQIRDTIRALIAIHT